MGSKIEWNPPLQNGQHCFFSEAIFNRVWPVSFTEQLQQKQAELEGKFESIQNDTVTKNQQQFRLPKEAIEANIKQSKCEAWQTHHINIETESKAGKIVTPKKKKAYERGKKDVHGFNRRRVPYPRDSSLSRAQQKKYLELYHKFLNYLPAQPSKQELKDIQVFKELQMKVGAEQEEFLSFLEGLSKTYPKDYAWIHPEARQYVEEVLLMARRRPETYPKWYNYFSEINMNAPIDDTKPFMNFLGSVLDVGPVLKVVLPNMNLHPAVPIAVSTDYDKVSQRFPTRQRAVTTHKTWNKEVCSKDENAEKLAEKYGADVVLSSSVLKCLVDNQAPAYQRQWEIPVKIKIHLIEDSVTKEVKEKKIVYLDKPFVPKHLTVREKSLWFHKLSLRTFLTHLPTQKLQKLIKEQQSSEGKDLSNQGRGQISKSTNQIEEEEDMFGFSAGIEEVETFGVDTNVKSVFSSSLNKGGSGSRVEANLKNKLTEMKQDSKQDPKALIHKDTSGEDQRTANHSSTKQEMPTGTWKEAHELQEDCHLLESSDEANIKLVSSEKEVETNIPISETDDQSPQGVRNTNNSTRVKSQRPRFSSRSDTSDDEHKLIIDVDTTQADHEKPARPLLNRARKTRASLQRDKGPNACDLVINAAEKKDVDAAASKETAGITKNDGDKTTEEVVHTRQTRSRSAVETANQTPQKRPRSSSVETNSTTEGTGDLQPAPAKRGRGRPRKAALHVVHNDENKESSGDGDRKEQNGEKGGDTSDRSFSKRQLRSNTRNMTGSGEMEESQIDVKGDQGSGEVNTVGKKRGRPRKNLISAAIKTEESTDATTESAKCVREASMKVEHRKKSTVVVVENSSPDMPDTSKDKETLHDARKSIHNVGKEQKNQCKSAETEKYVARAGTPKVPCGNSATAPLDSILQMQEKMLHKGQATPKVTKTQGQQNISVGEASYNKAFPQKTSSHQQHVVKEDASNFVKPLTQNLVYSLWTFGNLKLLVRSNIDGVMRDEQLGNRQVAVVPKLEYQAMYGAEQTTFTETARMWMTSFLRQNCSVVRARINAFSSEVMTIEEMDTAKILYPRCPFNPDVTMPVVHRILDKVAGLPEGNFILSHEKGESICQIRKSAGPSKKGSYNLHNAYLCADLTADHHREQVQWVPIDPNVLLPYYHKKFDRIPATFDPKDMPPNQKFNTGKKQGKKAKQKKKK